MRVLFGYFSKLHTRICLVCGSVRVKEQNTINERKNMLFERDWTAYVFHISLTTRHSIMNTIGRIYAIRVEINKHALLIHITRS